MISRLNDFNRYLSVNRKLGANSIRHYISRYKLICCEFQKKELNKENVEKYFLKLKDSGLANNSLNTYSQTINHIYNFLKEGDPNINDFRISSFPKEKSSIDVLTIGEIELLLGTTCTYGVFRGKPSDRLNDVYRTMIRFLALTGCRYSEAADLKVSSVSLEPGTVTFKKTKNKEWRRCHITEPLISEIKHLIEGSGREEFVFQSLGGSRVSPQNFSSDLKKRAEAVGIVKKIHPHLFRHSYATQLLRSGVDISIVATLLGHKDIQTTYSTYAHLADDVLRKASYKHPLVMQTVPEREVLEDISEIVNNFPVKTDSRFNYEINKTNSSIKVSITAKSLQ